MGVEIRQQQLDMAKIDVSVIIVVTLASVADGALSNNACAASQTFSYWGKQRNMAYGALGQYNNCAASLSKSRRATSSLFGLTPIPLSTLILLYYADFEGFTFLLLSVKAGVKCSDISSHKMLKQKVATWQVCPQINRVRILK